MPTEYTELQLDALRELANIGSGNAGTALAGLVGRPVDISVPTAKVLDLADAVDAAGPADRPVTAVVLPIFGDMDAMVLLVFGEDDAALACRLLGVEPGSEYALSAVGEIGNILGASYVNALGQMTGLALEPRTPEVAEDMLGAIVASVVAAGAADSDVALVLDSALTVEGEACELGFVLIPSHGGVDELLNRLGLQPMNEAMVRIGEYKTTKPGAESLVAVGLGSCVGVVLVDRAAQVTGLAHVMLPSSEGHKGGQPGKFADSAIPALVDAMEHLGARSTRLEAWLAGGASMFSGSGGSSLDIGGRNAAAVKDALSAVRVPVRRAELGGRAGRTMRADGHGRITVKAAGGTEQVLAEPAAVGALAR